MRGRLYAFYSSRKFPLSIFIIYLAGFFWLVIDLFFNDLDFTPCFFKNITGYACPACGTSRAFYAVFQGQFMESFMYNPLWVVVLFLSVIVLPAMVSDLVFGSEKLRLKIKNFDNYFSKKRFLFYLLGMLIVINWCWNLSKY